jgi:hypothetical protein
MPWTNKIIRSFQTVPINSSETDFHGPYNKLLHALFPLDTDYTVVPDYVPGLVESLDPIFRYEVLFENKTVFMLDIKPPGQLRYMSELEEADQHIRRRLEDLKGWLISLIFFRGGGGTVLTTSFNSTEYSPMPVLHAVSTFGTRLCFYKMCRGQPIEVLNPAFFVSVASYGST